MKPKKSLCLTQQGFTVIEVMLSVAISALMLIGVISGVYISINQQRYNDALRDFAEYVRTVYSEVISPQSFGLGNSPDKAVLGKVLVFGLENDPSIVYSATLVGNANYPATGSAAEGFIDSLTNNNSIISLVCGDSSSNQGSTKDEYTTLWQTHLMQAKDTPPGSNPEKIFKGTMIIARSLTSATIHTAFLNDVTYDLKNKCQPDNHQIGNSFGQSLKDQKANYDTEHDVGICVKMDGNSVSREVRIAADGRNTSAIKIMDEKDSKCR